MGMTLNNSNDPDLRPLLLFLLYCCPLPFDTSLKLQTLICEFYLLVCCNLTQAFHILINLLIRNM